MENREQEFDGNLDSVIYKADQSLTLKIICFTLYLINILTTKEFLKQRAKFCFSDDFLTR